MSWSYATPPAPKFNVDHNAVIEIAKFVPSKPPPYRPTNFINLEIGGRGGATDQLQTLHA